MYVTAKIDMKSEYLFTLYRPSALVNAEISSRTYEFR